MSALPNTVKDIDLLRWVVANPKNPFDPNMLVYATHTTDWQWQAVTAQMAELKRLAYISQLSQDPGGSTYWTITSKGENYLRELERAEKAIERIDVGTLPISSTADPVRSTLLRSNVLPPMLEKNFGATKIAVRRTTSLTFTLSNPNVAIPLTNISFEDPLPVGLVISEPNGLIGSYGVGNILAPPRGNIIRFSVDALEGNGVCSFSVNIEAVDAGPKNNFTSAVSFAEGDPVIGASASLIVIPDESEISLAEQLALRLEVRRPNEYHAAMASVFAPRLAITSFEAVSTLSLVPNPEESIDVQSVHNSSVIKNSSVVWVDESRNLVALQFPVETQIPLPEDLIVGADDFVTSGKWESYIFLPGRGAREISGFFGGPSIYEGREYQVLNVNSPIGDTTAITGAPVVTNGKLVGIINRSNKDGSILYASIISREIFRTVIDSVKASAETDPSQGQPASTLAGYKSDDPIGDDLLDVTKEAYALASVLAAKEVDPPLSLGLFGDWGTGKSFFMRCLEKRIDKLTSDAKEAEGRSQYCQDIVQLTFNAWNYIDKDLWASLAAEIFEGLAAELAKKRGGDSKDGRALALATASSSVDVVAETERQKNKAEAHLKESEQQLTQLQNNQNEINLKPSTREVLNQAAKFAINDENVRTQVQEAANELGLTKGITATKKIKTEILELDSIWTEVFFTLRNNRNFWVWAVALLAAASITWGVTSFLKQHTSHDFVTGVAAFVTSVFTFLTAFLTLSRKVLAIVRRIDTSKQELINKTQTAVVEKIEQAKVNVAQATEKVKILNQQLEEMRADRQMVDFIRQRYESSDYRNSLGTIARVRADFKHLSTLLRDVQQESEKEILDMKARQQDKEVERREKAKPPLFPKIDRIILYIDDLDRCPEKNVFEVLQAVHLLLAFPLFVVVVGVDPRWLLRSLKRQTLVSGEDGTEGADSREEESQWGSTAMNYLEKIFQIPFTLQPINKVGFSKLVDAFATPGTQPTDGRGAERADKPSEAASREEQPISIQPNINPSTKSESNTESTSTSASQQTAASPPRKTMAQPPEPIDRNPRHLQIEERERTFMKTLYKLIPSPRAGKRLINIYRLLRASVNNAEYPAFIGNDASGEYQCALLLLGMLTGYPSEASEILEALIRDQPNETWGEFLNSIKEKISPAHQSGEVPKIEANSRPNSQSWNELFSKLQDLTGNITLRPCSTFVKWAPRVARYSFQSGRTLLFKRE
jgi:hypothetical protein